MVANRQDLDNQVKWLLDYPKYKEAIWTAQEPFANGFTSEPPIKDSGQRHYQVDSAQVCIEGSEVV
jgi:hypothetical protein